jgi:hypothetical protein
MVRESTFGGHVEGDARGEVGLDEAGDDVHARALGRQHQVDAGGARLLGDAGHRGLDVLGRAHHQIGELVDDHHDVGQLARRLLEVHLLLDVALRFSPSQAKSSSTSAARSASSAASRSFFASSFASTFTSFLL